MLYKATVAVCSDIRTKHSSQSDWMLNLAVRKETARILKINTGMRLPWTF